MAKKEGRRRGPREYMREPILTSAFESSISKGPEIASCWPRN